MKRNKLLLLYIIGVLLVLPLLSAATPSFIFKQYDTVDLKIPVINNDNSVVNSTTNCIITIRYPNETIMVNRQNMTFNTGGIYNYTFTTTGTTGEYPVTVDCNDGVVYGFSTFSFRITPTGTTQTNILDNPMILVFLALGILLVALGIYMQIPWFGFIGAIMFVFGGVYTMIYGFNNVSDLYSQTVALTMIGLGFIFMFSSAYEWIWGGGEGD